MQLTNTLLLTLSAAALTLAAPQFAATPDIGVAKEFPASDLDFLNFTIPGYPAATTDTNPTPTKGALAARGTLPPQRMRYCQHDNGKGDCRNVEFPEGKCINLDGVWDNRISSTYLNSPWWCDFRSEKNCKGRKVTAMHPGIFNFKTVGLNDQASSYYCYSMI